MRLFGVLWKGIRAMLTVLRSELRLEFGRLKPVGLGAKNGVKLFRNEVESTKNC